MGMSVTSKDSSRDGFQSVETEFRVLGIAGVPGVHFLKRLDLHSEAVGFLG